MTASGKRRPPPFAVVIFGANGDLTKRLIAPALCNLADANLLPERFAIIGIDRNKKTNEEWRAGLRDFLKAESRPVSEASWSSIASQLHYLSGDFLDAKTYGALRTHLDDRAMNLDGNALFYLAVPDRFFSPIVEKLGEAGLLKQERGRRRVVVEKPFGHDLESARALNAKLLRWLSEDQIFRIDHFLGKETVQNILAFRFANGLFEPLWNRDRIDHVQVTVAETIGVEGRGRFYEATGALRDMVPNHLFQLVAMTAMEPPLSFAADAIRNKKADLFASIRPPGTNDVVRGQYGAGVSEGRGVPAYRAEEDVSRSSTTETYVALKLEIDNWRWAGVPFYLRTGKRLAKRTTEISIHFKRAPLALFQRAGVPSVNWLVLHVQPDEGICLSFNAKKPGATLALEEVALNFRYSDWFDAAPWVGYETLIYDCLIGDATLFQRADQVESAWAAVEPVLHRWADAAPKDFPNYAAGSEGPATADALLRRDGRSWRGAR